MQAEVSMSTRLEKVLNEERTQASQDRQELLSQITSLVSKSGETQDARWQSKVDGIRSEMGSSRSTFEAQTRKYSQGMDVWSQKENLLIDEVL
ncbi:MAG: hypothetical protein Q9183_004370, partial [Haloplaca sp. 2 TL-2023]